MFKVHKLVLGGAAVLALASPVHAVTVSGVTWDETSPFDFQSNSANIFQFVGDPLSGFGRIDFMNTDPQSTFCPGCEVTFEFGNFNAQATNPNADGSLEFTNGFVNVYRDNSPDFDINNAATAGPDGDTVLWLSLVGSPIFGSDPRIVNLDTTLLATFGGTGATGVGALDVTGGDAQAFFDGDGQFGGADFEFQNSFTQGSQFSLGSGNFFSETQQIPEPTGIALLGLGLVGIGAFRARNRKA